MGKIENEWIKNPYIVYKAIFQAFVVTEGISFQNP